ncbi:MAG TPA: isoprenyl transferase [Patescibacteria group bacterium]|nr:isoprenyl transferase [Patescibacteria group bacterium]
MNKGNLPRHVAIIMDGNGRWAQARGLPRLQGHREGVKRVKEVIRAASQLGIEVVTLFAFSTENWSRPRQEVQMLMRLLIHFLKNEIRELRKNNVRFLVIGRQQPLPDYVLRGLRQAEEDTKDNTGLKLVLALNYGSRQEIVDAAKKFARQALQGAVDPEALDTETFGAYFYTAELPDPDLLIRTSGEMRISNFLLWQLSYAELYFQKVCWPEFGGEAFKKAVQAYQKRQRRFGRLETG